MSAGESQHVERAAIERIVREVLAELAGGKRSVPTGPGDELALAGKVIGLEDLKGRLNGVARVVLPRGAVVTPAARDEIRQRGIALASVATAGKPAVTSSSIVVATAETTCIAQALVRAMEGDGLAVTQVAASGLIDVVDQLCGRILQGVKGLLLTSEIAAAVCLANRQRGVRAVQGACPRSVAEAAGSVGANLLVIDPQGRGLFELRRMIVEFTRINHADCPAPLRDRLS